MEPVYMLQSVRQNIGQAIVGKQRTVDLLLIALLCGGHVLIEDMPGLGKTTLCQALAQSLGCSFRRIQFTPDVLPSDLTGFTMFNLKTGEKELHPGSVMHQIVLADEINRCSPKTQSALLEVMQENQVTVDGVATRVPEPFMVLATENPVETAGTYPLPEAQLDRFLMRLSMGYPTHEEEKEILRRHRSLQERRPLQAVASAQDVLQAQRAVTDVRCSDGIHEYIVSLVEATRSLQDVQVGISPRGAIALMQAARGRALLCGRDYVLPDDVQDLVYPVLSHRLVLRRRGGMPRQTPGAVLRAVLQAVPVPEI